jgi:hypothetical protein
MSPYCPTCLGVSNENEVRCPLDQQFLRRRSCVECDQELFPREIYCAACGYLNSEPEEVLILPPAAAPLRQAGSLLLDYLTLGVLVFILVSDWSPLLALVMIPVSGLAYRSLGRSGGRQTFGQTVFGIGTVSPEAGPAMLTAAVLRSLWELLKLPFLITRRPTAEADLEKRSGTLEVTLV